MSVAPKKSLGQHFLRDPNTVRKIVDALEAPAGAPVVEIGPGTGALTYELADRYPRYTALEVDERAIDHLMEHRPELDVRRQDVLEADWAHLAAELAIPTGRLYVVGNLPYYITSPILFGLLDGREHIARAVVMMQKEVAQRLVAKPRSKEYGILTVLHQLYARPRYAFTVPPTVFFPKPKVDSAVIVLDYDVPAPDVDATALRQVVRTAFGQRRKMLRGSLKPLAERLGRALPADVETKRPEDLPPAAFVDLTHALFG